MKKAVEQLGKDHPDTIKSFVFDKGTEFFGSVKRYLKENNYKIHIADPEDGKNTTSVVERFNKSLESTVRKRILFPSLSLKGCAPAPTFSPVTEEVETEPDVFDEPSSLVQPKREW